MNIELYVLCGTVVLGLVHIALASHTAALQRGYRWAASARDNPMAPLTGIAARLARAQVNFQETFSFFAALVLAIQLTGANGLLSKWGVLLYLVGRVLYVPLYAYGVYLVRSIAWNVATFGIMLLLASLLAR